jgi:hypothetical protein
MASGHVNRIKRPNTWLHRPMLQNVKKALANPEPSTHGTFRTCLGDLTISAFGGIADVPITRAEVRRCEGFRMPADDDWRHALRGRRPQTFKGGNRGTSGKAARQTLWGFRRAVCCRDALTGSLGSDRWGGELSRPIATGITGVARRRLIDEAVVQGGATASMVMADREPAKQRCGTGMSSRT